MDCSDIQVNWMIYNIYTIWIWLSTSLNPELVKIGYANVLFSELDVILLILVVLCRLTSRLLMLEFQLI